MALFDFSSGRGQKKKFVFQNVTTAQEYSNFITSGLSLAKTGQIGDVNSRAVSAKRMTEKYARRDATRKLAGSAQGPVEGQITRKLDNPNQMVGVNNEQVQVLTSLYQQRLNDILTRRARPGFRQVQ